MTGFLGRVTCGHNVQKSSDRKIAEHCGVSPNMVKKYRKQLEATVEILQSDEREGLDGRTTNTANIGSPAVDNHRVPDRPAPAVASGF